ncbi:restriction endonuclease subunit S [Streptomyces sp. SPB074]|uniref:restriction endonuclease subunit S n=1 Tax=Streptomyces sp. (strain SPB074) TaxID=465543 RepID=UPI00017F2113|nr:restriction endonuclease subunit S [Streptomyces sp. SPB074]EDY46624.1 phosphoribosylformylglycinamidine synthase [Streptomyces sp. SPB074]
MRWPEVRFEEALRDVSAAATKIPKSRLRDAGALPVVDQGRGLVAGYVDDPGLAQPNEVPVIVFGDHTRRFKYVDFPFAPGADGVKILAAREGFDPRYLYQFLASLDIPDAGYARHFKFLKNFPVVKPPLAEQQRIAALLDHVDALRAKRREATTLLDSLAQSVFLDMFGDPAANPRQWPAGTVADLVAGFESGKSIAPGSDEGAEKRVLKVSAVTSGEFRGSESKPVPEDYTVPPAHLVREGDLLFSRANTEDLIGAVALVEEFTGALALPDKLWRFVWHDGQDGHPLYVRHLFRQKEFRRRIRERASGTSGSMKNISQPKVLGIRCGIPPEGLRAEFCARVRSIDASRRAHRGHLAALDELFTSLRHRAFSGSLGDHEASGETA